MRLHLEDRVRIDGIEMTCTMIKTSLHGIGYCLAYFSEGNLHEYEFSPKGLDAFGAVKTRDAYAERKASKEKKKKALSDLANSKKGGSTQQDSHLG